MAQLIDQFHKNAFEPSQGQAFKVSPDQLVEKIAAKLISQGLSLDNIAKLTGLSKTTVSKLYQGCD